eukprot:2142407-Amphidinium_carterae.1
MWGCCAARFDAGSQSLRRVQVAILRTSHDHIASFRRCSCKSMSLHGHASLVKSHLWALAAWNA